MLPVPAVDDLTEQQPLASEDVMFLERTVITWLHLIKEVLNASPDTSSAAVSSSPSCVALLGRVQTAQSAKVLCGVHAGQPGCSLVLHRAGLLG